MATSSFPSVALTTHHDHKVSSVQASSSAVTQAPSPSTSALPSNAASTRAWASTFEEIQSPSSPNAPATAPVLSTQDIIKQRLSLVGTSASITDALTLLRHFEVRKLPLDLNFRDLLSFDSHYRGGGTACFDAANAPHSSWCAHQRCRRCSALNVLMQADSDYTNSAIGQVNIATALLTTDCVSQRQRKGVLPTLPLAIVQKATGVAIYDMFAHVLSMGEENFPAVWLNIPNHPILRVAAVPEYNATLRALMHASNITRSSLDVFIPATVTLCPQVKSSPAKFHPRAINEKFLKFLPDAVAWYLRDVSLRKHQPLVLPACNENLLTIENKPVRHVKFEVTIIDEWKVHPGKTETAKVIYRANSEKKLDQDDEATLTVRDAAQTLSEALRRITSLPPRCANAFWRIFSADLRANEIGVRLAIKIELPLLKSTTPKVTPKIWVFDTYERRKTHEFMSIE